MSTKIQRHVIQDSPFRRLSVTLIQIVTSPFNLEVSSCTGKQIFTDVVLLR